MRKDGSRFWADSVLTSIRNTSGAVTGYAKVTRDFIQMDPLRAASRLEWTPPSRKKKILRYWIRTSFTFNMPTLVFGKPDSNNSSPLILRPEIHFPFS